MAPQIHWFCPANDTVAAIGDVQIKVEEPDLWHSIGQLKSDHLKRLKAYQDCMNLYAYDGREAIQLQEILTDGAKRNLERCDQCTVAYHKVKSRWLEGVEV